jgi:hypothetical protein
MIEKSLLDGLDATPDTEAIARQYYNDCLALRSSLKAVRRLPRDAQNKISNRLHSIDAQSGDNPEVRFTAWLALTVLKLDY